MPVFIDVLRQQSPVFEVLGGDRVAWGSLWWIVLGIGAVILRQRIEQIPFVVAGLQIGATLLSLVVWWHPGEGSVLWVLGLLVMQAMLLPWWYRTLTLAAERRRLCVVGWVSLVGLSGNLLFFLDQNVLWGLWMVISVGLWFLLSQIESPNFL